VRTCEGCRRSVRDEFRFCPDCGTPLRVKVVEHFRPSRHVDGGWLRVSVYLRRPQHVRISIWKDGEAQAATSLDPAEAQRLADFLSVPLRIAVAASLRKHAHAVRALVRELVS